MSVLDELHDSAMEKTFFADQERRRGNAERAVELFEEALELELRAIAEMTEPLEPTYSILYRSAGWLALGCNRTRQAEQLAAKALSENPPPEIAEELRDLLEQANFQRHLELRGVTLGEDELQMSLSGQEVGLGSISSDELLGRIESSSKLLQRILERRRDLPFRERGAAPREIREGYQLLISVPRAASFAVTLRLGHPSQMSFPGMLDASEVVDEFMSLMELVDRSRVSDIAKRIPDPAYLRNFFGLAKKIAPDGKRVRQVGFTSVSSGSVRFVSVTKHADAFPPPPIEGSVSDTVETVKIQGVLRYADATRNEENTIRVIDGNRKSHTVQVPEGIMNDIVRPMWDSEVVVEGAKGRSNVIVLDDIRLLESD